MEGSEIYHELQRIEGDYGYLSPHIVLEEASDETSVLHPHFDWDDETAAHNHRLWQARQLIKSVQIKYKGKPTKAFMNVTVNYEENQTGYISTEKVLKSEVLTNQTLQYAVNRIEYWQNLYGHLDELSKIVDKNELKSVKERLTHAINKK